MIAQNIKDDPKRHIYEKLKGHGICRYARRYAQFLNKCFKSALGKSAHDLLSKMLVLEAKVLLKQTNMTIYEIAYKIGRNEISDFARFFKAQTGMKPTDYRNVK